MSRAAFTCACGAVRGELDAAPRLLHRVGCYCDDCQAFAHYLKRSDLLDAQGRSDLILVAPSALKFTHGTDRVAGVRLSPKGLYRFRAACCDTPVGNMRWAAVPFVSLHARVFRCEGQDPDALFGAPRGAILGQFAIGEPPPGTKGIGAGLMVSTLAKLLGWKLSGRTWPHPFFERGSAAPRYPLETLAADRRAALRKLCGPKPTSLA